LGIRSTRSVWIFFVRSITLGAFPGVHTVRRFRTEWSQVEGGEATPATAPPSGAWLDSADVRSLTAETKAWSSGVNGAQRGVDWQMRIGDARCKLASVYLKMRL
jgi:hypothetical protein